MKYITIPIAVLLIIIASPLILIYTLHLIALRIAKTATDDSNSFPAAT